MSKRCFDDIDDIGDVDENTPVGRLKSFRTEIYNKLTCRQLQHFDRIIMNIGSYRFEEIGPTLASIDMVPIELWGYILKPLSLADKMRFYLAVRRKFPRFANVGPGLEPELIIDIHTYQYKWVDLLKALPCLLQSEAIIFRNGVTKTIQLTFAKCTFPNLKKIQFKEKISCFRFLEKHARTLEVLHLESCQALPKDMPKLVDLKPYPCPREFASDLPREKWMSEEFGCVWTEKRYGKLNLELAKNLTTWEFKTRECWRYADCLGPEYSPTRIIATLDGLCDWVINKRTYPMVTEMKIRARYTEHDIYLMSGLRDVAYAFPNVSKLVVKPTFNGDRDHIDLDRGNPYGASTTNIDYRFLNAYFPKLVNFRLEQEKSILEFMFWFPAIPEIDVRSRYRDDERVAEYALHICEPNPCVMSLFKITRSKYRSYYSSRHFIRITPP
jgi:hypothetical protein